MKTTMPAFGVTKLIKLECYKARDVDADTSLRILLADDNRPMAEILKLTLEKMGHEVIDIAPDGRKAVELVLSHRPDMVMMDISMPVLDGISAASQILAEYSCPILFTTGMTDAATLKRAQSTHAQAYLVKPFTPDQLKSAIQMAVGNHRQTLAAELEIKKLRNQLDESRVIEQALLVMMQQYQIDRNEASEQLATMALNRGFTLADAAKHALELLKQSVQS